MNLSAQPLPGSFGVTIPELDLARLTVQEAEALRGLLKTHALVVLRRQCLHDADLHRASQLMGRVEDAANARTASQESPGVVLLSNLYDAQGQAVGGLGSDEVTWHADQYFRQSPATLSILYAALVPTGEGDTWWCNTRMGHEALSPSLQARIAPLRGCYRTPQAATIAHREVTHPLVLPHPGSPRHSLYVSLRTFGVEGMEAVEGRALLDELLAHNLREAHLYRHTWRVGDVVLYDNGQTLHRRDPFTGPRFMKATRVFLDPSEFPVPN